MLLHARYWKHDGASPQIPNTLKYDPHGFGLGVIQSLDILINQSPIPLYRLSCVSLEGAIAKHHKGDSFGHQVHCAATSEQWEAAKDYWESTIGISSSQTPKSPTI
jgi:hypothetical protein